MLLRLNRPFKDGSRAVLFEPLALLKRLAALIPRPHKHLVTYHGILGPAAFRRANEKRAARGDSADGPSGLRGDRSTTG